MEIEFKRKKIKVEGFVRCFLRRICYSEEVLVYLLSGCLLSICCVRRIRLGLGNIDVDET